MKKETRELYLEEDQDLLDSMETIGNMSSEFEERKKTLTEIQIKAILRSRKTYHDMDESTSRYSLVLVFIGCVQFVVAMMQFALSVDVESDGEKIKAISFLVIGLLIAIIPFWKLIKAKRMER